MTTETHSLNRRLATMAFVAMMLAAILSSTANAALASASYHVTTDVSARSTATAAPTAVYGIPAGAAFSVICQQLGEPAGPHGNTLYFSANYAGRTFFIPDAFTDSPHLAGQPPIAGIPMCGSTSTPPVLQPTCNPQQVGSPCYSNPTPPAAATATSRAVAWATTLVGSSRYNELCLTFVFDAYSNAGVTLRNWVNVAINNNTYPVDVWGHFTHGTTGTGTPPAGALVFYKSVYGRTYSHVTLSVGNGRMISSSDSVASGMHYETLAQHSYAIMLGWWLPT